MNKYKLWYDNIINRAKNRVLDGYSEQHHIIPRSLGGADTADNLVALTAREHFICHLLLIKFTSGQDRNKMLHAAILMKSANKFQDRYFNSRLYETVRREYSAKRSNEQSGAGNSFYGKTHSAETRAKMSASKRELYSNGKHPHIGTKRSEQAKKNISESKKGKPTSKKGTKQGPKTTEQKQRHKDAIQGKCFWWTDGISNVRAAECPAGYKKGRTMSPSHLAKFSNSVYLLKT